MFDEVTEYRLSVRVLKVDHIVLQIIQLGRMNMIKVQLKSLFLTVLSCIFLLYFDFFIDLALFSLESFDTLDFFVLR